MDEKTRRRELDEQMAYRPPLPARAEGEAPGAAAEGAGAARRRELRAGGLLVYPGPARAQRVPCFTDLTVTDGRGRFAALSYCWDAGYGREWSEGQFGDVEGLFGPAGAEELAEALETWDEWMGRAQSKLGGLLGGEDLARAAWDSWGPVRAPGWEGLCAEAALGLEGALRGVLPEDADVPAAAPLALRALRGWAASGPEAAGLGARERVSPEGLARLAALAAADALAAARAAGLPGPGAAAQAGAAQAPAPARAGGADPFAARRALRAGGLELAHWGPGEAVPPGWEYVAVRREGQAWGSQCLLVDYTTGELVFDDLDCPPFSMTPRERDAVEAAMLGWPSRAEDAATGLGSLVGLRDAMAAAWDSWGPVRAPGWEGLCAQAAMAIPEAVAGRSGDVARTALPCAVASMALDWLGALAENVVPGEDGAPALEGLAARDLADAAVVRAMADIDWNNEGFQENALADLAGLQGDLDRAAGRGAGRAWDRLGYGRAAGPAEAPAAPAAGGGDDESEDEEAHL